MIPWIRAPEPIPSDTDRRTLAGIFTSHGMEFRVVSVRANKSAPAKKYVEFRAQEKQKKVDESDGA